MNVGRGETLLLPAKGREGGERGDDDISICLLISRAARAFRLLSSGWLGPSSSMLTFGFGRGCGSSIEVGLSVG